MLRYDVAVVAAHYLYKLPLSTSLSLGIIF